MICFSETYLDSSVSNYEKDILVKGYSAVRADHPSNTKRGGVCIYYKESLGVLIKGIPNLTDTILCQVANVDKTGYVLEVYRSASQSSDDFEHFLSNFDQVITDMSLSNPAFRLIFGDFNCRSNSWWEGNIFTKESIDLESVSSFYGLHQQVTDPTHILTQSFSCIDLIFSYQTNHSASVLSCFDDKLIHSCFILAKSYNNPVFSFKLEFFIMFTVSSLLIYQK